MALALVYHVKYLGLRLGGYHTWSIALKYSEYADPDLFLLCHFLKSTLDFIVLKYQEFRVHGICHRVQWRK